MPAATMALQNLDTALTVRLLTDPPLAITAARHAAASGCSIRGRIVPLFLGMCLALNVNNHRAGGCANHDRCNVAKRKARIWERVSARCQGRRDGAAIGVDLDWSISGGVTGVPTNLCSTVRGGNHNGGTGKPA